MQVTKQQIIFLVFWTMITFLISGIMHGGFYGKWMDNQRVTKLLLLKRTRGQQNLTTTRKPYLTTTKPTGCKLITTSDLSKVKTTKYGIPLIMHQIYKENTVPVQYIPLLKGCRRVNPDFVHLLWTDDMMDKFLNTFYPEYKSLYANYREAVMKADFFRVLLLYHFGGVYIDMDVECKKPLSKELDQFESSAILDHEIKLQTRLNWGRDHTAMNSAMMSRKGHPFFKHVLNKFPTTLKHNHVMWRTGPFALHDFYEDYQNQKPSKPEDRVHLAPPNAFSPLVDPILFGRFNAQCSGDRSRLNKLQKLGCDEWVDELKRKQNDVGIDNAIMVHRFMHLVYSFMRHSIRKKVDICKELPNTLKFKI